MKINEIVLGVLNRSEAKDNKFFLPEIQMERKLYVETNKVLESIGLKWNRKEKCHIAEYDIEEKLGEILETGEYTDIKKEYQFFETPKELAQRMVEIAEIKPTDLVLEPSAGRGAISDQICGCGGLIEIELNKDNFDFLQNRREKNFNVLNIDFLEYETKEKFNKIIMNPPFSKQQDIDHIMHAFELLANGGTLVAICSASPFFRENKKSKIFRRFLHCVNAEVEELPEGTFKESGTMVKTRLIIIKK